VDVLAQADTPHIDSLIAGGAFTPSAINVLPTVSGPNWSSMMIGAVPAKHGVHSNNFETNAYDAFPDFLTRLERVDSAFYTVAIVDWPPLASSTAGGPLFSEYIDIRMLVNGDDLGYAVADSLLADEAVRSLGTADPDAMFVYLGNVDVVGHATSSLAPEYRTAIETADRQVGAILDALQRRPAYVEENWLVLMSTDHGRRDDGGHGGESDLERTVFVLASGPDVVGFPASGGQVSVMDVAATALAHLGVAIDTAWALDGGVVGLSRR
jgi:predicted AlkP superfamily pyrophosphatase or phosphodiesterase